MIPVESRAFTVTNHATHTLQGMADLREQQILCDIVLKVGDQEFPAHRVVLAGSSPYLKAMFTNGMLETGCQCVTLYDIDSTTMEALLDYIYSGRITISVANVQALLHAASLFGLTALRGICSQFLQLHLDPANCLGIQSFADMYSCSELESVARQYVYRHFIDVAHHDEFLNLSEERLILLLQSNSIRVTREEQAFEALMLWIDWDAEKRSHSAYDTLKHIRLALIDETYLEEVILHVEFVQNCSKCQALVGDALRQKAERVGLVSPDSSLCRSLAQPRSQLQGVFVLGGRNGIDCQLSSVEWYDTLNDHWVNVEPLKTSRTAVGAAACRGLIYAVGGECALADTQEETAYLRSMEAYDPSTNSWRPCSDFKVARSFIGVCAIGQYLYAIGGEDRASAYNIVERYDTVSDSWSFMPNMKKQRSGAGTTVCNGKIYVAGGYDKNSHADSASVECFDPDTFEWSFVGEMEKARSGLSLVTIDFYIYAIGGRSRYCDFYYRTVERFNTWTQQWSSLAAMNTPRAWPAVAVLDNNIYVIGGFDSVNRLRSVEVFNPEQNIWSPISGMNVCRAGCAAVVL